MPYVDDFARAQLDPLLDPLLDELGSMDREAGSTVEGNYTYVIYRALLRLLGPNFRYTNIVDLIGVPATAILEAYRTQAAPYEDRKRIENGDVRR